MTEPSGAVEAVDNHPEGCSCMEVYGEDPACVHHGDRALIERLRSPAEDDVPVEVCRLLDDAADWIEQVLDQRQTRRPTLADSQALAWMTRDDASGEIVNGVWATKAEAKDGWTSGTAFPVYDHPAPTPSDQEKRISELEEALKECARVLRDRIPRIGPEGPNTADEQQEYEEVGGAWSMADHALSPERSPK